MGSPRERLPRLEMCCLSYVERTGQRRYPCAPCLRYSDRSERKAMTYKAYIDNIKTKTGKDPEYFQALAEEKGLVKHAELLAWLKSDCGLGHGHANAMILYIQNPELARRKIREDAKKEKTKR